MSAIRMNWAGDKAMREKLKRVAGDKGMRKQARAALLSVGEVILGKVQAEVETFKRTGRLLRSLGVRALVSGKKENLRITIFADKNIAPHAYIVHAKHPEHAGFLQRQIMAAVPTVGRDVAARIDLGADGGA